MKLPFPMRTLNANAKVYKITLSTDGEPIKDIVFEGRVNHVKQSKQVLNAQRELVHLSGWIVIPGDTLKDIETDAELLVEVAGLERRVFNVNKPDDLDDGIFSTELFLT